MKRFIETVVAIRLVAFVSYNTGIAQAEEKSLTR